MRYFVVVNPTLKGADMFRFEDRNSAEKKLHECQQGGVPPKGMRAYLVIREEEA